MAKQGQAGEGKHSVEHPLEFLKGKCDPEWIVIFILTVTWEESCWKLLNKGHSASILRIFLLSSLNLELLKNLILMTMLCVFGL